MRKLVGLVFAFCLLAMTGAAIFGGYVLYQNVLKPMATSIAGPPNNKYVEEELEPGTGGKIALIDLRGTIDDSKPGDITDSMVADMNLALRQAVESPAIKAIIFRIDSPGGEITASDSLYVRLRETRKKKPVVVYMAASACSGAYYAACGASYLIANETTTTGSIGVIVSVMNYKDLMGKVGLQSMVFKSGALKDILSGSRDMTKPEQDYIQLMVLQAFDKFLTVVSEERKIGKTSLREQVGDGRIISGRDALAYKLIDKTGTLDDAIAKARELIQDEKAGVVRFVPPKTLDLVRFFGGTSTHSAMRVDLGGMTPEFRLEPHKTYLLPASYAP